MAGVRHGMCELTAWQGRGTAWARHTMYESAFNANLRGSEGRFRHFSDEKDSCLCLDSFPVLSLFAIPTEFSWQWTSHILLPWLVYLVNIRIYNKKSRTRQQPLVSHLFYVTYTKSRWEKISWLMSRQVYCSHDPTNAYKWRIFIKYFNSA